MSLEREIRRRFDMKVKALALSAATAVIVPVAAIAGPAFADSPGQIAATYSVKNLTQNTEYSNSTNANACDEVQYSVRLHNPSYTSVSNVTVKATLPAGASKTNTSNLTVTYTDGIGSPSRASATVNLSSAQSISYEPGSAILYGAGGKVIKTLPDGVTDNGVNVGSIGGSTTEYVNFKAKVNCPKPECKTNCTPPPVCKTNCTPPPSTPPQTTPPAQTPPTTLVNTGPGDVIGLFAAVTAAGALGYRIFLSRRLARQ